jgi:hypothetical protein
VRVILCFFSSSKWVWVINKDDNDYFLHRKIIHIYHLRIFIQLSFKFITVILDTIIKRHIKERWQKTVWVWDFFVKDSSQAWGPIIIVWGMLDIKKNNFKIWFLFELSQSHEIYRFEKWHIKLEPNFRRKKMLECLAFLLLLWRIGL